MDVGSIAAFLVLLFLAVFLCGWAIGYVVTRRLIFLELRRMQAQLTERITASIRESLAVAPVQESRAEDRVPAAPDELKVENSPIPVDGNGLQSPQGQKEEPPPPKEKPVEPEAVPEQIRLVIAAAVSAFLGKTARIKLVKALPAPQVPWTQMDRSAVKASPNSESDSR